MAINVEELRKAPITNQLIFAVVMCDRLYPNYVLFSNNFSFGNPMSLKDAIITVKQHLLGDFKKVEEIQQKIEDVEANTPDTEEFSTDSASSALDACCTIINTLHFIVDSNFDHIRYVSTYGTDSADRLIISNMNVDVITSEIENSISNSPIMLREISIQNRLISFLTSKSSLSTLNIWHIITDSFAEFIIP